MSDIPAARADLLDIAASLDGMGMTAEAGAIRKAVALLHRRPYARDRAPTTSVWVDASLAADIRLFARRHPSMSLQAIAEVFNTGAGRVSEALQGDR
jgi:ribosomal protein S9